VSGTDSNLDLIGKAAGGRKLIAIVYVDMVGYSRLIGLDDAGTLRRLRTLRQALIDPAVREHGGQVVQTGGDSLLVAFDSIDGAVRCAVKVQQQVPEYDGDQPLDRRIRFRIGINIGDVIPDGTDLHGDGVNIAARLEAECPAGGICVSRSVRDHVHGRLKLPFEAIGSLILKNIAQPVEAFVLRLAPNAEVTHPTRTAAQVFRRARGPAAFLGGIALLLLVGAGGFTWWLNFGIGGFMQAQLSRSAATPPDTFPVLGWTKAPRLSVAVLPFENLSGDAKDSYLADGLTEDITTDLSRLTGMFVIARESAYTYQGKAVDVRKIGEELGVRYVLEGSVRKLGDALRVNAQLIATENGAHLWAERFDLKLNNLVAGQDEIVSRIGQTLNVALSDIESARSKREHPTNADAFDLILRAQSLELHPMGPEQHADRIGLLEQALRLDPSSIYAMTQLAHELVMWDNVRVPDAGDFDRAAKLIADAAAINQNHALVLDSAAYLYYSKHQFDAAITAYRRLLDEYPNAYWAYHMIGYCLLLSGQAEQSIPMFEMAIRRDPRGGWIWDQYAGLGLALLVLDKNEESIIWQQRALAAVPVSYASMRAQYQLRLAAAYARLKRLDEAHRAVVEASRIWPYDTVRSHAPPDPSSNVVAEQVERYQAALRLAGHRDHAAEGSNFGVTADGNLRTDMAGLTPTGVPGATTILTAELQQLIGERKPVVIDPLLYSWGRSIAGAVGLENAGHGGSTSDAMQDRLRKKMQTLTNGDPAKPIVAIGWNSERFDGRNLALRLIALGFTHVYWYRGGREAWEVNGLPETQVDVQHW
jgi:adenylate cyclase